MFTEPEKVTISLAIKEFKISIEQNIDIIENKLVDNEQKPDLIKKRIALLKKDVIYWKNHLIKCPNIIGNILLWKLLLELE